MSASVDIGIDAQRCNRARTSGKRECRQRDAFFLKLYIKLANAVAKCLLQFITRFADA